MSVLIAILLASSAAAAAPDTGAAELRRSGFIGVSAAALTDETRASLPAGTSGIVVQAVIDGGSAKAAGLEPADVITEVGDHAVADVADFVRTVKALHAGDTATIHLRRGGEPITKRLVVKPKPYESAPDVDTFYKAVTVDGTLRRVVVTAPKGAGKHPAVLYLDGIGCFTQESADLSSNDAKLLYGLTRAGFVTMRVEKSGVGDSLGEPCASDAVDLAAERRGYLAGLEALTRYPFVDAGNVFLVGISIGGVQAPLVAGEHGVKGIVVVNTIAKPLFEYLLDTRRRQNLLAHVPYDEMERKLRINERCNHRLLVDKQPFDEIVKASPECRDFVTFPASSAYMQQWADVTPAAAWTKVEAPVLVVYGSSDYVSTIADDPYLADLIDAGHPGRATLKEIPAMDHGMSKAASMAAAMSRPAGTPEDFEPAVLEAIRSWLAARAQATG
jgi:dienelactone hydrolase